MRTKVALVAGVIALAGCYAEISDDSVTIRRSLPVCDAVATSCTFRGVPLAVQSLIPLAIISGETEFTIDLGGDDFVEAEWEAGPLKMKGNLALDGATLQMTTPGASFAGVEHLEFVQIPVAGCSGACVPRTIASYDRVPGDTSDPTVVVLTGTSANLLDLGSGKLTIRLMASGTLPTIDWVADLTLRGKLSQRGSF